MRDDSTPPYPVPATVFVLLDAGDNALAAFGELFEITHPGSRVDVLNSWPLAIEVVQACNPRALVVDVRARDRDKCLAAVASLRSAMGETTPLLIALTADVLGAGVLGHGGFDLVLSKPVDFDSLLKATRH